MSKRTAPRSGVVVDLVPSVIREHGLVGRYARGQVEVDEAAADPDDPKRVVTRLRATDLIAGLHKKRKLTDAQAWAAHRFRDDCALAEGAREGEPCGGKPMWDRSIADIQLDALTRRAKALQAVGIRLSAVLIAVTIGCEPMRTVERDLRLRNGRGPVLAAEALELLAVHYAAGKGRRV